MAKDSNKYIRGVASQSSSGGKIATNKPSQYGDRKRQYLANGTARFAAERSYLASDYVNADCQGLNPSNFYEYRNINIRLADISSLSASATKKADDWKEVLFPDQDIDYCPIGAKIQTMGNTWLVVNPSNISSVKSNAVVARCNTSYNSYDHYGNVVTEPLVAERPAMMGNDNLSPQTLVLLDGYFNITCQLNENTKQLGQNQRLILGTQAFHITGFTDFIQEYSGDRDSVHLLTFTARIEEVQQADDITTNYIANGKNYTFGATIDGATDLIVGQTSQYTAIFTKNGDAVQSTAQHPISWIWSSNDESKAVVNANGQVTGTGEGTAIITATLAQNPNVTATFSIDIQAATFESYVKFTGIIPTEIKQYTTETLTAISYQYGIPTQNPLTWTFSGAAKKSYSYKVANDGMSVEITCLLPAAHKLTVTATDGSETATTQLTLEGY